MDTIIIKREASGMKAAIIDKDILEDEKFCLKLYKDGTAHFMSIDKANELSKLIRKTIDLYFAEKQAGKE